MLLLFAQAAAVDVPLRAMAWLQRWIRRLGEVQTKRCWPCWENGWAFTRCYYPWENRGADEQEVLAVLGERLGFDEGLLSVGESDNEVLAVGESVGFKEERGAIRTRLVGIDERIAVGAGRGRMDGLRREGGRERRNRNNSALGNMGDR